VSGSGIRWTSCKPAPHSRQITTPLPGLERWACSCCCCCCVFGKCLISVADTPFYLLRLDISIAVAGLSVLVTPVSLANTTQQIAMPAWRQRRHFHVGPRNYCSPYVSHWGAWLGATLRIRSNGICIYMGCSVAEWLACWTQAQKGPGSNRSRDAVG